MTIVDIRAKRSSCGLSVSAAPGQRSSTACDESSSAWHVQLKDILQNPVFQQRCHELSGSTKHLVWIFLRLSVAPKIFSVT